MRSLYWKIFLSFWLASILIIVTVAWFTRHIAQESSTPAREHAFMDSYANAAVVTYESGNIKALSQWLNQTGLSQHMRLFLIRADGKIINSNQSAPAIIQKIAQDIAQKKISGGIIKTNHLTISHAIHSNKGHQYRLVAESEKPLSQFIAIEWAGLTVRITFAIFFSGLICYFLSLFLTQPIRLLQFAAAQIAAGKLNTRVTLPKGHKKDEIAELAHEFNRMAEQIEALLRSKERLLQDISHELRSPLARLQIAVELLRKKSPICHAEFERIDKECARLNTLIGEILEFARLEKSTSSAHKESTNISELITNIVNDANFEHQHKQQTRIKTNLLTNAQLNIDKRLIHRAIENIIRNALHYTAADTFISISLYKKHENQIYIDIDDEGPGVPESQLKTIFNPFYRVDPARENKTGGYGLGLAIAYEAVRLHNGQIIAQNRAQGGLRVRIILDPN